MACLVTGIEVIKNMKTSRIGSTNILPVISMAFFTGMPLEERTFRNSGRGILAS
jgi:hypothetical protein